MTTTTTTTKTSPDDQVKAPKSAPKPVTDRKSKLSWLGVH